VVKRAYPTRRRTRRPWSHAENTNPVRVWKLRARTVSRRRPAPVAVGGGVVQHRGPVGLLEGVEEGDLPVGECGDALHHDADAQGAAVVVPLGPAQGRRVGISPGRQSAPSPRRARVLG
jgi:hypothetical protein